MNDAVYDMMGRLTIYGDALPKQARWQGELLYEEKLNSERMQVFFADIRGIEDSAERIAVVIDEFQAILGEEREAIMATVDEQTAAMFGQLRAQVPVLAGALQKEREATLETFRGEREATFAEMEAMSVRVLDESTVRINRAIDHFYWRAVQLLVVLGFLTISIIVLKRRMVHKTA